MRQSVRKPAISFRLTNEAKLLLKALDEKLGIGQRAALEMAIRELALKHGIKATSPD